MGVKKIFKYFLVWRALLFVFLFLAISILPLQFNFLGGGVSNYLQNPHLWSWANFDGEHYLAIARDGYKPLTYFFFPLYPILTGLIARVFGPGEVGFALSGLLVSHGAFLAALIGLVKLIRVDYGKSVVLPAILLLILFPTSFYFGSFYTESLFLALSVWSFYFARKKNFLWAGILGGFASATRVVGIVLFPAILAEYLIVRQPLKVEPYKVLRNWGFWQIFLIPLGLLFYMYFLNERTGDPLHFFNSLSGVYGAQRSTELILLPQVFYRYIVRILPNLDYNYFPVVFTTILELLVAVLFLVISAFSFFKTRLSYAIYLSLAYLVPTLSGSFSSLPRYVLVLFPAFVLSAVYIKKLPRGVQYLLYFLLFICLGVATSLFARGYWVS